MISKFKKIVSDKVLVKNFSFLTVLQFSHLLIGFLLFPYLIKVLGRQNYGVVIYAQAVVGYLLIILNYGFNITATKQVASNKENMVKLSEIISTIYITKGIILIVLAILFLNSFNFLPFLAEYKWIYVFTFFNLIGWLLYPEWYFQGVEKMENITYVMLASKLMSIVLIYLLVKQPADFYYVPIINSSSMIISGGLGVYLMMKTIKKGSFKFVISTKKIKEQFKSGFSIFLSNIVANSKDYFNTFIIGVLLSYKTVAIYDMANKIIKVSIIPSSILYRVVFPRIVISKSIKTVFKVERLSLVYTIFIVFLLFLIPNKMLSLFILEDMEVFKNTLYLLSLSLPLLSLCGSRGMLRLVAFGKDTFFSLGVMISAVTYILIVFALHFFNSITIMTMVMAIIFSLTIEFLSHFYFGIKKNKLHE